VSFRRDRPWEYLWNPKDAIAVNGSASGPEQSGLASGDTCGHSRRTRLNRQVVGAEDQTMARISANGRVTCEVRRSAGKNKRKEPKAGQELQWGLGPGCVHLALRHPNRVTRIIEERNSAGDRRTDSARQDRTELPQARREFRDFLEGIRDRAKTPPCRKRWGPSRSNKEQPTQSDSGGRKKGRDSRGYRPVELTSPTS